MLKNDSKTSEQARQALSELFTKGVVYDPLIWSQNRVLSAAFKDEKKITRVKFFPTNLVTGQIFRSFYDDHYKLIPISDILYSGHYGISKSFSTILFAKLSNIIAEYHFKKDSDTSKTQKDKQIIKAAKIIYLNYVQNDLLTNRARLRILSQFSEEFSQQEKESFLNSYIFLDKPNNMRGNKSINQNFLQKNIKVILIIDQISQFIGLIRKLEQKKKKAEINPRIIVMQDKINIFQDQIKCFHDEFDSIIYYSSMNIEKHLLNLVKLSRQNSKLNLKNIFYGQNLHLDQNMYEIIDMFLFELQSRTHIQFFEDINNRTQASPSNSQAEKQKSSKQKSQILWKSEVRESLFQYLKTVRYEYFLNFYFIRLFVAQSLAIDSKQNTQGEDKQKKLFVFKDLKPQQLLKKIQQLFKQINGKSIKQMRDNFLKFLLKRNLEQGYLSDLLFQLYFAAQISMRKGDSFRNYEINLQKFSRGSENQQLLQLALYKETFSLNGNKARCLISPKIIFEILDQKINKILPYLLQNQVQLMQKFTTKSGYGGFLEILLIKAIRLGNLSMRLNSGMQYQNIIIENIQQKQYDFQEIPQDQKNKKMDKQKNKVLMIQQASDESSQKNLLKEKIKKKRLDNWMFLSSFDNSFKEAIKEIQSNQYNSSIKFTSHVHVPVRKNAGLFISPQEQIKDLVNMKDRMTKAEQLILQSFQKILEKSPEEISDYFYSQNSKSVDFIIVSLRKINSLQLSLPPQAFSIYAFDITTSENQNLPKIKKFIEEFSCFGDRNVGQISIDNKKYPINLHYVVLSSHTAEQKLAESLSSSFEPYFQFSQNSQSNFIEVISKEDKKNCILKTVGCINFYKNLILEKSSTSQNIQSKDQTQMLEMWKFIQKDFEKRTQRTKQIKSLIKQIRKLMQKYLVQKNQ